MTMGRLLLALCILGMPLAASARTFQWQPSPGHHQVPIWPGTPPDAQPARHPESAGPVTKHPVAGKPWVYVSDVSRPTLTVYSPKAKNGGAAVIVFPGGGFEALAIDLEGTEICDWLTARGITCVLLKYRVPSEPYNWQCDCRPDNLMKSAQALDDAQRTIGLVRFHAKEWHVDPHKIGVIGFSAGGYLVAEVSTDFDKRTYAPVDEADRVSCRPDFAIAIYPGHLHAPGGLNPNVHVTAVTPPTFLLQAEDDHTDSVNDSLDYYIALKSAGVPTEIHLYAQGGHAFGLRRTKQPITEWPRLVERWLQSLGMVPN